MFDRTLTIAASTLIIGVSLGILPNDARAACTAAQWLALQQQNMSETRMEEICGSLERAEGAQAQSRPAPGAAASAPTSSDRCYTPAINCILFDPQRVGSSCWCVTPFGPSYGRVK